MNQVLFPALVLRVVGIHKNHHARKEKKTVQKYCLPFEVVRAMDERKDRLLKTVLNCPDGSDIVEL